MSGEETEEEEGRLRGKLLRQEKSGLGGARGSRRESSLRSSQGQGELLGEVNHLAVSPGVGFEETVLTKILGKAESFLPYGVLLAIPVCIHRAPKHKCPDACMLLCNLRAQGEADAHRMHPGMHVHACVHIGEFDSEGLLLLTAAVRLKPGTLCLPH